MDEVNEGGAYIFAGVPKGDYNVLILNEAVAIGDNVTESLVDDGFSISPMRSAFSVDGSGEPMAVSPFIISSEPLNVNWISFNAQKFNDMVRLEWEVSNMSADGYFEVEFSRSSSDFSTVGKVELHGGSRYSFDHKSPVAGDVYYRIKVINENGGHYYSPVIKVYDHNDQSAVTVYPNPAQTHITLGHLNGVESVIIYDLMGKEMERIATANMSTITHNISHYPAGQYILNVQSREGTLSVIHFVKQ